MKETDHQTQIVKSVRKQGGYSFKLSNRFTIGIPDLLIGLYPFAPCLAEVKDLGECVRDFSRKLDVSPKQNHELRQMNAAYPGHRTAFILVTLRWKGLNLLVPLPQGTERLEAPMLGGANKYVVRQSGSGGEPPWYHMHNVLSISNAAKVMI